MTIGSSSRFGLTTFTAGSDAFLTRVQYQTDVTQIDALAVIFLQGTYAAWQGTAPGVAGRLFMTTGSPNGGRLFYDNGAAWTELLTAAAASVANAQTLLWPVGSLMMFAGNAIPTGWLLCDGSLYAAATWPALSTYLGAAYARPAGNFAVPDYRGQVLVGNTPPGQAGLSGSIHQHSHGMSGTTSTEQGTHVHANSVLGGSNTGPELNAHTHDMSSGTASNAFAGTGATATISIKAA